MRVVCRAHSFARLLLRVHDLRSWWRVEVQHARTWEIRGSLLKILHGLDHSHLPDGVFYATKALPDESGWCGRLIMPPSVANSNVSIVDSGVLHFF
jgi:hypothetical protein